MRGDGPDLAAAITTAVRALPPAKDPDGALVLDVAVDRWDGGLVPIVSGGRIRPDGGLSPSVAWRPGAVERWHLTPEWRVSQPKEREGAPARFESAVADAAGGRPLMAGWQAPEAVTPESLRAAALAGARHIIANQATDGRFTYVVKGPSGRPGRGYNLPRHAGTAWFLARVAARTGDPEVQEGARRAVG